MHQPNFLCLNFWIFQIHKHGYNIYPYSIIQNPPATTEEATKADRTPTADGSTGAEDTAKKKTKKEAKKGLRRRRLTYCFLLHVSEAYKLNLKVEVAVPAKVNENPPKTLLLFLRTVHQKCLLPRLQWRESSWLSGSSGCLRCSLGRHICYMVLKRSNGGRLIILGRVLLTLAGAEMLIAMPRECINESAGW